MRLTIRRVGSPFSIDFPVVGLLPVVNLHKRIAAGKHPLFDGTANCAFYVGLSSPLKPTCSYDVLNRKVITDTTELYSQQLAKLRNLWAV